MRHIIQGNRRKEFNPDVLFVGGAATKPGPGASTDGILIADMESLGWNVTYVQDSASVTGDATGKHGLYLSSTSGSASIGTKFKNVSQGIAVSEGFVWDDMDMVGGGIISNVGGSTTFENTPHPLTDFLTGTYNLSDNGEIITANTNFGPDVFHLGYVTNVSDKNIFLYEKGSTGANAFVMPGRRVGVGTKMDGANISIPVEGREISIRLMQWVMAIPVMGL